MAGAKSVSYPGLLREFENIYSVPVVNGFVLCHSAGISDIASLRTNLALPGCEVEVQQVGPLLNVKPLTGRSCDFTAVVPSKRGVLSLGVGKDLWGRVKVKMLPGLSWFTRVARSKGCFTHNHGLSWAHDAFRLKLLANESRCNISGTIAVEEVKFGVRHKRGLSSNGHDSTALLLNTNYNTYHYQLVTKVLGKRSASLSVYKDFGDQKVGGMFRASDEGMYFGAFGWNVRINGYDISSSVNTQGSVRSSMSTSLNDKCGISAYQSLNHAERRYRCGLALKFD